MDLCKYLIEAGVDFGDNSQATLRHCGKSCDPAIPVASSVQNEAAMEAVTRGRGQL